MYDSTSAMMLKRISCLQLKVGMYVHDFDCGWLEHPFLRNHVLLAQEEDVARIIRAGIREVVIDCQRGLDVGPVPAASKSPACRDAELEPLLEKMSSQRASFHEELGRAEKIYEQAAGAVQAVMHDVRLGKAVQLDGVRPVVEKVTASILRNPNALLALVQLKSSGDATFSHSVSVCALLVAFCKSRGLDKDTTFQAGLGGLLHDIGKAVVPTEVLNKPGALTDEEFAIIQKHPRDGYEILKQSADVGNIALDITLHHHERLDGSGYPDKLVGSQITELAKMAAIVDVYDALTTDRCYHKGMPPAAALRKIYESSKCHFEPTYVQQFMRCVGIFPVGTVVLLESGRLGVVVEANETNLLAPKVNVFFNTKSNVHIRPETVDLAKGSAFAGADKIASYQSAIKWSVDPSRFMVLAS